MRTSRTSCLLAAVLLTVLFDQGSGANKKVPFLLGLVSGSDVWHESSSFERPPARFRGSLVRPTFEERLRLVHADVLRQESVKGSVQRVLEGKVEFQQGKTNIKCDQARQTIGRDPVALIGNVQIRDATNSLLADTVYFYQETRKQVALANVVSVTETDTTYAGRLTYFETENRVTSERDVRIVNPGEGTVLTGGIAEYWRNDGHGKIFQNPAWTKYDTLGVETTRITGDSMQVFKREKRMVVSGNVTVLQPRTSATCNLLTYFETEGRALLTGSPRVSQSNQEISGDTLRLFFVDSKVTQADVVGDGLATSDADTLNRGRWVNKLTGQLMHFSFENEGLRKVVIKNQATSEHHIIEDGFYKGMNEVSGDRVIVFLEAGRAQRVEVASDPEFSLGKYVPPLP